MSADLPKTYDPTSIEQQALGAWKDEKLFHAEPTDPGSPYAIVIPPPNVTAALHLGHALNNTLQDVLTRWRRMGQDNAVWIPGTDHAGIATQTVVEKRVLAEEGKRRTEFSRDEFVQKIQAWKDEYEQRITDQLKRMGCSCDWDRQAFTMDEPRARAVREAFFQLFKDGLIYRGKRLVNWDPVTQTALADDEVEMEEIEGSFYYLRYPIVEDQTAPLAQGREPGCLNPDANATVRDEETADRAGTARLSPFRYITVATTRPETMLGDTAVAINPKDPRAAQLRGKMVLLPIVNRIVPIIEDDYVVLPDPDGDDPKAKFATGFLKVTPAHDPNDYEIGQRHKLPMVNIFSPTATISKDHGWPADDFERGEDFLKTELLGKDRFDARKLVVDFFKQHGLLEDIKPYRHSVGHSYRSHVPIEPYLSDQWYCKVTDERLAGAALRAMSREQYEAHTPSPGTPGEGGGEGPFLPLPLGEGRGEGEREGARFANSPSPQPSPEGRGGNTWERQLRFYPPRYAKTFQTWHENLRDWCISRQLWWGHRIPVWSRKFERTLGEGLHVSDSSYLAAARAIQPLKDAGRLTSTITADFSIAGDPAEEWVCLRYEDDHEAKRALEVAGYVQDPDVLDTWFSSGLWPMSTLGWPDQSEIQNPKSAINTWNPTSVLCTAREIITLWVSRMVMFNLYFLNRLPFYDVFIHAMIQDGHGQKMSKSLGNGVDPMDIIHSHGADAMRFTLSSMATNTQDVRLPVDMVDPHSGETLTPKYNKDSAGHIVAAPIQESPKDPTKKMVSSYGVASGKARPTPQMPLARNTSSKFDLGRNFCNKLWNAARFAMMNLYSVGATPASPSASDEVRARQASPLQDRWIISRFNRTIVEADEALKNYRVDQYAKACYDFFWRDFCDWYLEAIKPAMKDPARAPHAANVLAAVLDGSLRLMHPMIPFITEIIWWRLNEVRPQRGLPGLLECPPSERLVRAVWPNMSDSSIDADAEQIFSRLQEIIAAIRNVRNAYKVDPRKPITLSIKADSESARQFSENREMIELLATCRIKDAGPDVSPPKDAARGLAAGVEIYLEGLVDAEAEKQRSSKRRDDLTRQITALRGRLSNESYVRKAPPHLVEETKTQLAEAEAELAKLG